MWRLVAGRDGVFEVVISRFAGDLLLVCGGVNEHLLGIDGREVGCF